MSDDNDTAVRVERTWYLGAKQTQRWVVQRDYPAHLTYHTDLDSALLMVRAMLVDADGTEVGETR